MYNEEKQVRRDFICPVCTHGVESVGFACEQRETIAAAVAVAEVAHVVTSAVMEKTAL